MMLFTDFPTKLQNAKFCLFRKLNAVKLRSQSGHQGGGGRHEKISGGARYLFKIGKFSYFLFLYFFLYLFF